MSNYPYALDDSLTLPITTDNVTPVKAEVVNNLRSAILAIESELGIDPSGTYGTVRARLDALSEGGGGGGGGAIEILQNGVEVLPSALTLDFAGSVNITVPQPLRARIEIVGGQATQVQEGHTAAFNGQTIFTLAQTPIQPAAVMMFVNGIKQEYGFDYSVTGVTATYGGSLTLLTSDKIEFWYIVDIGGMGGGGGSALTIKSQGSTIETATTSIDFEGAAISAVTDGSGHVTVTVTASTTPAKVRAFRTTSAQAGASVGSNTTATWNGTSTLVTASNASITGSSTQLTTTAAGLFLCSGQLSIQPTTDAVSGVTVEVLLNGTTVVETVSDYGAVWGIGVTRSLPFSFPIDLSSGNTLQVRWRHSGSSPSATQLMTGDSLSWFAISEQ